MRILILLWDGGGNVPPALSLASALLADGHEVHVASHDTLRTRIEERGLKFLRYESGYVYDPSERGDFEKIQFAAQQGLIFGSDYYPESVRLLADVQPDVVLVDGMLSYAVKACLDSAVPTVCMWHTLYAFIAGGPFAPFFDDAVPDINKRGRASEYATFQGLLEAANAVLVFTCLGFDDLGSSAASNVHFVGPLREVHEVSAPPSTERPFVVVALSSVFTNQTTVLNELAAALGSLDVDALITTGRGVAPDEIVAGDNVEVRPFVPHDAVLPHADLLVTHGGCGTVMAGLQYGNPMLCLPNGGDQPLIGARLERFGLGRTMDQHSSAEEFAATLDSMIHDTELRDSVRVMANRLKTHAGVDDALAIINAAVPESG